MNRKSDLFYAALHIPVDLLAVIVAFIVSYQLRGAGAEIYGLPYNDYLNLVWQSVLIWLVIFGLQGMYNQRNLFGTLQNLSALGITVLASWGTFIVFLVFVNKEDAVIFPRLMLLYILVFSFLFVFAGRLLLRGIQYIARSYGLGRRRFMLVGKGDMAHNFAENLKAEHDPGITFVTYFESHDADEIEAAIKKHRIDELVIADQSLSERQTFEIITVAQNLGVVCHVVPDLYEVQTTNVLFSTLGGLPILTYRQTPLEGWGRIMKRTMDIVVSGVSLILLSPLFLIIAVVHKLTDGGPVFYRQARLGRSGKIMRIFKFRSMKLEFCTGEGYNPKSDIEIFRELGRDDLIAEWTRDQKVKVDPRILPMGRFLRKTSIDELPQLINVFVGDLSLVGRRPIREEELKRYARWGSYLLSIKPGLTGLWQVSGRSDISYDERVRIDSRYVQNWSFWQDLSIIIKTFFVMFGRKDGV